MFKRLQYLFLAFLVSLPVLFAESFIVRSFNNILGDNGLGALLKSESFLYGFYFILILFTMQVIFKQIFVSIKLGEKPSGMIAFMFSAIGTSGIFYMFGQNQKELVSLFGGFFGFLIILVIGFVIAKTIIRLNQGEKVFTAKWFVVVFGAAFVYNLLIYTLATNWYKNTDINFVSFILETSTALLGLTGVCFVFALIASLIHFKGKNSYTKKHKAPSITEQIENSPSNKEITTHITEIEKNLKELGDAVNSYDPKRGLDQ